MNGPLSQSESRTESCNHRTRPNGKSEGGYEGKPVEVPCKVRAKAQSLQMGKYF